MAEPTAPTEEELEALMTGGTKPAPEMPNPEPEVIERAQKLIDEARLGATVEEGTPAEMSEERETARDESLTADEKLKFLLYLLGGQPYTRRSSLFGGAWVVTFTTVSAVLDEQLAVLARAEAPEGQHRHFYQNYLMAASLSEMEIDGKTQRIQIFGDGELRLDRFRTWYSELNREQYHVLRSCFRKFQSDIDTMLDKADDPGFWPTPS